MQHSAILTGIAVIVLVPAFMILSSMYVAGVFADYGGIFARAELNPAALSVQSILPLVLIAKKFSKR
jgi:hypothetical protein